MRVTALQSFISELGRHQPGDEIDMRDDLATRRTLDGLVSPVKREVRTATVREPEEAVVYRNKR